MGATADDVWLSGQPLFHIGGINGMLPFLALGAKAVITPTTGFDPAERRAADGGARRDDVHLRPDAVGPGHRDPAAHALRTAMWGAAPASRKTLEALARTYPGVDIVSAYGQTEMSGATTLLKGPDATRKMGSVGKPMRDVELRLADDVDGVGEIVYRGPFVMQGYWNNPRRQPRRSPAAGFTAATSPPATRRATCGSWTARRT